MNIAVFYLVSVVALIFDPYRGHKSHTLFWALLLLVPVIVQIIKKYSNEIKSMKIGAYVICAAPIISFIILGSWHLYYTESGHVDPYELYDGRPTTLVERSYWIPDNEDIKEQIYIIYYLKGHEIIFQSEEAVQALSSVVESFSAEYLVSEDTFVTDTSVSGGNLVVKACLSCPHITSEIADNRFVYTVDADLKKDSRLVCFSDDGCYYICSEGLYFEPVVSESAETDQEGLIRDAYTDIGAVSTGSPSTGHISRNMIIQIISVIILTFIGAVISFPLWGEKAPIISLVLALPVGTVIWSMAGVILTAAGTRLTLVSQAVVVLPVLLLFAVCNRKKYLTIRYGSLMLWGIPYGMSLLYFTCTRITYTVTYDCLRKIQYGLIMSLTSDPKIYFTHLATFGVLEPFSHMMGYMLGGDYLYTIYPMFFICAIGLFAYGLYSLFRDYKPGNELKGVLYGSITLGIIMLLSNVDYRFGNFLALSHNMVSFYFLLIFVFLILEKENRLSGLGYVLPVATAAIITTRTEGIIYILFLLTVIMGYDWSRERRKNCLISYGICAFWIIIQLTTYTGGAESYFFTPSKAIALGGAIAVCVIYSFMFDRLITVSFIKDNYHFIYILGLLLCNLAYGFLFARDLAVANLPVFSSHLSSYIEYECNSGYIWMFAFLWMAMFVAFRSSLGDLTLNVIMGYMLLVFLVFLLRGDLEIHVGIADSARRVLVHMMPTAIWLITATCTDITRRVETDD